MDDSLLENTSSAFARTLYRFDASISLGSHAVGAGPPSNRRMPCSRPTADGHAIARSLELRSHGEILCRRLAVKGMGGSCTCADIRRILG